MAEPYSELTVDDVLNGISAEEAERLIAAEEAAWGFVLFTAFDAETPMSVRKHLGELFDGWLNLAVETGILPSEESAEIAKYEPGPVPGSMF